MLEAAPAPACTRSSFLPASFLSVSGVAATRVSPARVSAGTPILMKDASVELRRGFYRGPRPARTALPRLACTRHPAEAALAELERALHHQRERGGRNGPR